MFDFAWSELALIGVIGLVFLRPKDIPAAAQTLATALKKARALAQEFQSHFDDMVRDTDMEDVRRHWNDLRSINLKDRLMRGVDSDGAIRKGLQDVEQANRLMFSPGLAERQAGSPQAEQCALAPSDGPGGIPEHLDPAPAFVPPSAARVVRAQRADPPPVFIPPSSVRPWRPSDYETGPEI